jgi:phosphoribosylanthranilate isomerase
VSGGERAGGAAAPPTPPVAVKICGLTRVEDALAAAAAGATAIGLNFWRPGRRCVSPEQAREIVRAVAARRPAVLAVAVFVDADRAEIDDTLAQTGCTVAQLHGEEPPALVAALGARAWKVLRGATPEEIVARARAYPAAPLLVDAPSAALPGGTGVVSPAGWEAARLLAAAGRTVWLAGGLSADNVAAAVHHARPHGVDVASGVELTPGVKDPARVRAFVAAARAPS